MMELWNFERKNEKGLHRPGIEPGPPPWQGEILPLDQRCSRSERAIGGCNERESEKNHTLHGGVPKSSSKRNRFRQEPLVKRD